MKQLHNLQIMRRVYILSTLLALLCAITSCTNTSNKPQNTPTIHIVTPTVTSTPNATATVSAQLNDARAVVQGYYDWYLNCLNFHVTVSVTPVPSQVGCPANDLHFDNYHDDFTIAFLDKLNHPPTGTDYTDPIICTQTVVTGVRYGAATYQANGNITVIVHLIVDNSDLATVEAGGNGYVTLEVTTEQNTQRLWQISNITRFPHN